MEPLLHFIIPFIILIAIGMEVKKAIPISTMAMIPDMDALFHIHRSISHSIIIPIVAGTLLLPYLKGANRNLFALGLLALASHPILDIFTGYTPIFWPLYSYSIWLQVAGMVHLSVHSLQTFSLYWQMLIKPIYFQTFESLDAPLFTGEGLILSVMLIVSLLFSARTRITSRVQQILQGALRNVLTTLA